MVLKDNVLIIAWMFLILLMYYIFGYFLQNRTKFDLEDKLSPVYNMASSGLNKMLGFIILYPHKSVLENVCPVILFWTPKTDDMSYVRHMVCLGRCYCLKYVVDVKTTRCYNLI